MQAISEAFKALGDEGIAEIERRYEVKVPDDLRGELVSQARAAQASRMLDIRLFDANHTLIESATLRVPEAVQKAADFVLNQGSDPEADGQDATAGSIEFAPVQS